MVEIACGRHESLEGAVNIKTRQVIRSGITSMQTGSDDDYILQAGKRVRLPEFNDPLQILQGGTGYRSVISDILRVHVTDDDVMSHFQVQLTLI